MFFSNLKIRVVIFFFLLINTCIAQKDVAILSGSIKGLDIGTKMYLSPSKQNKITDSLTIQGDDFQFSINAEKGDIYFISYDVNSVHGGLPIYLKNGSNVWVKIINPEDGIHFSGSTIADEQDEFYGGMVSIGKRRLKFESELNKTANTDSINMLKDSLSFLENEKVNYNQKWIERHKKSPVSVAVLWLYMQDADPVVAETLFNELSPAAKEDNLACDLMPRLFAMLKEKEHLGVGKKIGDFILPDNDGKKISFDSIRGNNYILIDFWASWCGPCRASTPTIGKLIKKYSNQNFKVISISADKDVNKWKQAIKEDKMFWTQLCDLKGNEDGFLKMNNIFSYPTYLIVSPDGIIISKPWDIKGVEDRLDEIFKNEIGNHN